MTLSFVGSDVVFLVVSGIVVVKGEEFFRFRLFPSLFDRLLIIVPACATTNDESNPQPKNIRSNFAKAASKCIIHLFQLIIELIIGYQSSFFNSIFNPFTYGSSVFWEYNDIDNHLFLSIKLLFLFKMGYFSFESVSYTYGKINGSPHIPKDYSVMIIHHTVAFIACLLAYLPPSMYKIGLGIVIIHDIPDVMFQAMKAIVYLSRGNPRLISIKPGKALLIITIVLWIYQRIVVLSTWVYSMYYQMPQNYWQKQPFILLMASLVVMHCYWLSIMLNHVKKSIIGKEKLKDHRDPQPSV